MNIFINGVRLNNYLYVNNVQGVHDMPPTSGNVQQLKCGTGNVYSGSYFEQRVITITCTALMSDGKLLADKMDAIKRILAPTGEKELVFGAYPERYIKGRFEGTMDLEQLAQMGTFNIVFYCSDPLYYDRILRTSGSATKSFNCENKGNWESNKLQLELTLNGACTISNYSTGKSLKLNGKGKVTVDFEKACIIGGMGVNQNTSYRSGEFFDLAVGDNNINCTVPAIFRYRSCYL